MTRRILNLMLLAVLASTATAARAQHGGAPGGGGPGGPSGGAGSSANSGGSAGGSGHYEPHGEAPTNSIPSIGTFHHGAPVHGMHSMGLAGRWWDDAHTAKSLGLSSAQQKQMDGIFEAARPAITERFNSFVSEQKKLNDMPNKDLTDESKVNAALDRVTEARADLERTTAGVLTQIRGTLTESQQARLDDAISKQK